MLAILTTLPLPGVRSTASEPQSKIKVDNAIAECVRVVADDPRPQKNLLLVSVRMDVIKSIGGCGCKSGAIRYRTYETYQGRQREMNRGLLNSIPRAAKADDVLLVLSSDTLIRRRPPFSIDIACGD